jgi:hypothetical protein
VPGFETNSQQVVQGITYSHISLFIQPFVDGGGGEPISEIVSPQASLPHVKIPDAVIRISWWRQGTGGQRKIPLISVCFIQKQQELLSDAPYSTRKDHPISHTFHNFLVGLKRLPFIKIVAGVGNFDYFPSLDSVGDIFKWLFSKKAVMAGIEIKYHFEKIQLGAGKSTHPGIVAGNGYGLVEAQEVKIAMAYGPLNPLEPVDGGFQ